MANILVSGLLNVETTLSVEKFPIEYEPIEYSFFGIHSNVSGVAFNIVKALNVLNNDVEIASMIGKDQEGKNILAEIERLNIPTTFITECLKETPTSVVLYDREGRRRIYCDLKDIQEREYVVENDKIDLKREDVIVICNINFNRPLLHKAKKENKLIATDVHVLSDIEDSYNKEFMEYADILFLSDENINEDHKAFVNRLKNRYNSTIIVLGQGKNGVLMYERANDQFYHLDSVKTGEIVNTVGAGDALFSSFIHYFAKGYEAVECLKRAEIFASYKIGFNGAACGFINEDHIEQIYNKITIPVQILT